MSDALDAAARALARRDRSRAGVLEVLRRKGVAEDEAVEAVETLRRLGAIDDERFAVAGAASLADRGFGDAAIAFRLEREGVSRELAERAVSALEPETGRARQLASRRGATAKTARWLASRGFAQDSVEAAIAEGEGAELG
ncbi:MAG TPA: RecX family transcriptional regulator [Gaiellaceae bacterium]